MPREPVGGYHRNPAVDMVFPCCRFPAEQVLPQGHDLPFGIRVVEHGEVDLRLLPVPRDGEQAFLHGGRIGREEPRLGHDPGEGVCVVGDHVPAQEAGLDHGRPPPAERVVDHVALPGQALDEEPGELRFEAGPVRDLVDGTGLPLLGRSRTPR